VKLIYFDDFQGSSTTDMMSYLTIAEKEKALSQVYVQDREESLKVRLINLESTHNFVLQKYLTWTDPDQVDFVKNLLQIMSHYQHGQIEEFFQPMLKRDFISFLPGLLVYQFTYYNMLFRKHPRVYSLSSGRKISDCMCSCEQKLEASNSAWNVVAQIDRAKGSIGSGLARIE
jgi:hypothetical protein